MNIKPGFHMIVDDRSRSLGLLANSSAIVAIIWRPNFNFAIIILILPLSEQVLAYCRCIGQNLRH